MTVRPRLSLRAWLLLSYLVVFCLPWVAIVGSGALDRDLRAQTREHLTAQGQLWALRVERAIDARGLALPAAVAELHDDLTRARERTLCATQIVDADGVVLASSGASVGQSLAHDPEVGRALAGDVAEWARQRNRVIHSDETELTGPSRFASIRLFVAVPIVVDDRVIGAVVTSRTPREEVQALVQMGPRLGLALLVVIAATFALALVSGHFGSRSLAALADGARKVAGGAGDATALAGLDRSHVREVAGLADAVAAMHARLQARLDYIDEFAGNVAHEFRTPISTLRGTLELIADDPEMPPEQRERFMTNAQAELQRLEALVDGLLALARAERVVAQERVELGALVRRISGDRDVAVEGTAGTVCGASRQLESVLENLLDNAERHGGRATVVLASDDAHCSFTVVDDGPGIAPADLPHVFDRFFTTDRSRGTGLGLALARSIVHAHGGTLVVESRPGRTAFTVRLPAASRD